MKKFLMGFAACALLITSCSQEEITEKVTDGQGQLTFAAGIGKQAATRAAELNNTALQTNAASKGIVLNAYDEVSPTWRKWFTDEITYSSTDAKWALKNSTRFRNTNATKYITYFPKTSKLTEVKDVDETSKSTFETANFTGKFPAFEYTVGDNSSKQEDLIAGITNAGANKTDITLGMRHILSQVNFGAVAYKGAKIMIHNIEIVGVKNVGTFTYKDKDEYPIGDWDPTSGAEKYSYYNYTNVGDPANRQPAVPATAEKGDTYIFGDGGNWGPGKAATTFYPVGTNGAWEVYNSTTPQKGLANSLMLMPQELKDAKVTFEYKIQDVDDAYVAGNATTWEKGEFSLYFTTGDKSGKHYLGKWEQNFRYVYLIDFTDFLDGVALTFTVDVDMYEWENYNKDTDDDDGIVDVVAVGQPSQKDMNTTDFATNNTWYIATQSTTDPTTTDPKQWAQVMRNEIWDMSAYDFTKLAQDSTFKMSFQNVIFNSVTNNPTTITMTLPDGFSATAVTTDPKITLTGTYVISNGDNSENAVITIKNDSYYRTSADLHTGIEAGTVTNGMKFGYGGTEAVDLTEMEPTALTTSGNKITVKFNSIVIPTVGAVTGSGTWTWDGTTRTATWTKL